MKVLVTCMHCLFKSVIVEIDENPRGMYVSKDFLFVIELNHTSEHDVCAKCFKNQSKIYDYKYLYLKCYGNHLSWNFLRTSYVCELKNYSPTTINLKNNKHLNKLKGDHESTS